MNPDYDPNSPEARTFGVMSRGGYRDTGADELRSRIAANPTDPAERASIINEAVRRNMTDEIPESWGIGVGATPEVEDTGEVYNYANLYTQDDDLSIVLYDDGTLAIENSGGRQIYLFSVDRFWADQELLALQTSLTWGRHTSADFDQLLVNLGDRGVDQTNQLYAWLTIEGGPGNDIPLVVGINQQGQAELMIGQEHYPFPQVQDVDKAIDGLARLRKLLEDDFT